MYIPLKCLSFHFNIFELNQVIPVTDNLNQFTYSIFKPNFMFDWVSTFG